MKITFLGATGTVTGSKYLIEYKDTKILVDCGLFQGEPGIVRHNFDPFPIDPATIDAIVLTHAHIDHTGYIPALMNNGFKGPIYCSQATKEISVISLTDSGTLQEEAAKKRHHAIPLYTKSDAESALNFFKAVDYDTVFAIKSLEVTLIRSGHILGSAFVEIYDGTQKLTFSGDLGRPNQPILKAPPYLKGTDFLVLESTYGSRIHDTQNPEEELAQVVRDTMQKGGVLIIPCFSVMRTQLILYYLYELKQKNSIPKVPIYLDSPSGIAIDRLFCKFSDEYILPKDVCDAALDVAIPTLNVTESKQLNHLTSNAIIISGSGMADGGRIPFHLKRFATDAKNTILFVGYQAKGSSGRLLVEGAHTVQVDDKEYPVRAEIKGIRSLSAHADAQEIIEWLAHFEKAPKRVFLTHGEPDSIAALKKSIEERFNWIVIVPTYLQSVDLDEIK
jgi:metallo-beta-lactamase family protein